MNMSDLPTSRLTGYCHSRVVSDSSYEEIVSFKTVDGKCRQSTQLLIQSDALVVSCAFAEKFLVQICFHTRTHTHTHTHLSLIHI